MLDNVDETLQRELETVVASDLKAGIAGSGSVLVRGMLEGMPTMCSTAIVRASGAGGVDGI